MRIYIANDGDTLRTISLKKNVELKELTSLNLHIASSDQIISGGQVILPDIIADTRKLTNAPEYPFNPLDNYDQWIPLTTPEKMAQTDYDVLIVGSGAGGGAVLWRLCERWGESGKKIGMVETGDLALPTHNANLPTLNKVEDYRRLTPRYESGEKLWPELPGAEIIRILGGKTIFWATLAPRFNPAEFKTWPIRYQDLVPYYNIAEQVMNVTPFYTKGSSFQEILLERLRFGGFSDAMNMPLATDLRVTKYGQVHSNVLFSSIIFMSYCIKKRSFDLAVNTPAVQVMTEKGKVVGVKVMTEDKKDYVIKAKTVILSAGAFETPRILLNSAIPGEAIGRYLVTHSSISGSAYINRNQFPEVLGIASILYPSSEDRKNQLLCISDNWYYNHVKTPVQEKLKLGLQGYGVVEPRFDNKVSLDPEKRDEYGVPKINITFSYSRQDMAIIDETYEMLQRFTSAMGLTIDDPFELQPAGWGSHEAGTCRMGNDPATSATDAYGQIHGVSGLYIANNSVLPLTSPANPTLTTIALAIRTADHIIEQMK